MFFRKEETRGVIIPRFLCSTFIYNLKRVLALNLDTRATKSTYYNHKNLWQYVQAKLIAHAILFPLL